MPKIDRFTPKYDWTTLVPQMDALLAEGLSITQVSNQLSIPEYAIYQKLRALKKKRAKQIIVQQAPSPNQTDSVGDRHFQSKLDFKSDAQKTLSKIAKGETVAQPGQVQALKLLLADPDQDEGEKNPYAGTPEAELAERCITLAASILGVHQCAILLRDLAQAGQADVLTLTPDVLAMIETQDVVSGPVATEPSAQTGVETIGE